MTKSADIDGELKPINGENQAIDHLFQIWDDIVFSVISHYSRSLKAEHLKLPGYFIMNYLYRNGFQKLSTLAEVTGVSRPTITGIVDKLENHGLIRRVKGNSDRRNITVELTESATEKVERVYLDRDSFKSELAGTLTESEISDFLKYIEVLRGIIIRTSDRKKENNSEGDINI